MQTAQIAQYTTYTTYASSQVLSQSQLYSSNTYPFIISAVAVIPLATDIPVITTVSWVWERERKWERDVLARVPCLQLQHEPELPESELEFTIEAEAISIPG